MIRPFVSAPARMLPAAVRPSLRLTCALVLTGALTLSLTSATAANNHNERRSELQSDISAAMSELAGTNALLQRAYTQLAQAQGKLDAAKDTFATAQRAADAAKQRQAELAREVQAAQAAEQRKQQEVDETEQRIGATRDRIGKMAANAYQTGAVDRSMLLALTSTSMGDLARSYSLTHAAMRSQGAIKDDLASYRKDLAAQVRELEEARAAAETARSAAEASVDEAEQAVQLAEESKAKVAAMVAEREKAADAIRAQRQTEEAELAALQGEARALEEQMRELARQEREKAEQQAREARAAAKKRADREAAEKAAARAEAQASGITGSEAARATSAPATAAPKRTQTALTPSPSTTKPAAPQVKKFVAQRPTNGRVSSPYGMRKHPIYKTQRMHTGLDLAAGCGTPVKAAASGIVHKAGRAGGYGNQVVINHGTVGGAVFATSYSHLKSFPVIKGSKVKRGQVIGYEGTTGASTGCHVHFEMFRDGNRVDPADYLP